MFYSKFSHYDKNSIPVFSDPCLCTHLHNITFSQCIGRKTLIVGEANVGKTELTSFFLQFLRNQSKINKIYVFEMGPERFQTQSNTIGGKLSDYDNSYQSDSKVLSFNYSITPPRSSSTSQIQVYQNCAKNFQQIFVDFQNTIKSLLQIPKENIALVINDFSIFLHLGSHIPFLKILTTPLTVFVNSYYGEKLEKDFQSNISWRERMIVRVLSQHFDFLIHLTK